MDYLDRGYGECLRDERAAEAVAKTLQHFDGERYHLGDFVVMPNHVHLLVCLLGPTEIESQCRSWKKYSAGEINRLFFQMGRFWQEESFDHLVRSPQQFEYFGQYIADNPKKAHLRPGEYRHYRRM
jgi:type I restriction enzyme R subunit